MNNKLFLYINLNSVNLFITTTYFKFKNICAGFHKQSLNI